MIYVLWLPSVQSIVTGLVGAAFGLALSLTLTPINVAAQTAQPKANIAFASDLSPEVERLQTAATDAMASQSWTEAENLLLQAQHALHREHGVVTPKQTLILDQLATTHIQQEDYRQANRFKEFNHFLGQRSDSIDAQVRAEIALARWYLHSGQFDAARRLLSTSLKAALASEPFVPERALLRLDIELFSAQCCHSDDAIALLTRAEAEGLPNDLMVAFAQKVSHLLTLDDRHDLAAVYYARQDPMAMQAPQLIPGLRRYNDLDPNKIGDMRLRQELRRRRLLAGGYPDDALWSEVPETFTVALNEDFLPVAQSPQADLGGYTNNFEPLIGAPFRFNLEQLKQTLPTRYRNLKRLQTLEVHMTLDITVAGKPNNIRFDDHYPRQVQNLMKKVLKEARFTPAIHNGQAVETLNLTFVQNFKARDTHPATDV